VYQRHDWKDEKRGALDAWGEFVGSTVSKAAAENVYKMSARRR